MKIVREPADCWRNDIPYRLHVLVLTIHYNLALDCVCGAECGVRRERLRVQRVPTYLGRRACVRACVRGEPLVACAWREVGGVSSEACHCQRYVVLGKDRNMASAPSSGGKAIPFLYVDPDSAPAAEGDQEQTRFVVNEEALAALRRVEGPIAVVAVAGLYRTGKSYLLNRIVGRQTGFEVGPTIEACTRGIWLWSEPIPGETLQGEPVSLIVLDTEGLGGLDASRHYDSRIFSLAVLLCSKLVYNSMGSISETAISNLSFVANLAKNIRVKAHQPDDGTEEDQTEELSSCFPHFLWIIRDFQHNLEDEDGNEITELDYLENALEQNRNAYDEETAGRNIIRQCLTTYFQHRECCTMVRPMVDESRLAHIVEENFEDLRPEFREGMNKMRTKLLHSLPKKTVRGQVLTGSMLATLAKTYVRAINDNGVPTIATAWEHMAEKECREGVQAAIEEYEKAMDKFLEDHKTVNERVLFERHDVVRAGALKTLQSRAVGDGAKACKDDVLDAIGKHFEVVSQRNAKASLAFCEESLCTLMDRHLGEEDTIRTVSEIELGYQKITDEYVETAKGPGAAKALSGFLRRYAQAMQTTLKLNDAQIKVLQDRVDSLGEESVTVAASAKAAAVEKALMMAEATKKAKAAAEAADQDKAAALAVEKAKVEKAAKAAEEAMAAMEVEKAKAKKADKAAEEAKAAMEVEKARAEKAAKAAEEAKAAMEVEKARAEKAAKAAEEAKAAMELEKVKAENATKGKKVTGVVANRQNDAIPPAQPGCCSIA